MRFLVTGGFGFIGSHLVEGLLEAGHRVRVLDDFSTAQPRNIRRVEQHTDLICGDVRDPDVCNRAVSDCDGVFHLAALVSVPQSITRPTDCHAINTTGTLNLLEAMRRCAVSRIVFASSAAVYNTGDHLPKLESMLPAPVSPYGVSKLASEHYLQSYAALHGMTGVALRFFNVYGPGQDPRSVYSGVISKFTELALKQERLKLFGDGSQTRDFIHVIDVVRANLAAMQARIPGGFTSVNIGTGRATSLLELIETLGVGLQQEVSFERLPARRGDVAHSFADVARMQKILGVSARISLLEGLESLLHLDANDELLEEYNDQAK